MKPIDVLCIGVTSYDLYYQIDHHPREDEKMNALAFAECGGGPAANAAFTAARLGASSAFIGYLGKDIYGQLHLEELQQSGVDVSQILYGERPTPLSAILIKPDGQRALINHRDNRGTLKTSKINIEYFKPKIILVDGHEPEISLKIIQSNASTLSILDAGSVHRGTELLVDKVNYLICSETFAIDFTGEKNPMRALKILSNHTPKVVITLGEKGLVWKNNRDEGRLPAYSVDAVDTTGAGDVFHGAFAFCLAANMDFEFALKYSSAAAAFCCTKIGGRTGVPSTCEIEKLMDAQKFIFANPI